MTSPGAAAAVAPMPIIQPKPKPEETTTSTVRLTKAMILRLDEIASSKGYSRNEVIALFLQWAIQQHEKEEAEALAPTPRRKG